MQDRSNPAPLVFPPLATLGRRICVCGPSNAGKSTLAAALGHKLGVPAIHLDQFRHLPNTNWQQRPDEDFHRLHDEAIAGAEWVIDGNYSKLIGKRLDRATGLVILGDNRWASLYRMIRRSLFERHRHGHLEGGQDSIKWDMIRWILIVQPRRRPSYLAMLRERSLPRIETNSMRELRQLYAEWDLTIPKP